MVVSTPGVYWPASPARARLRIQICTDLRPVSWLLHFVCRERHVDDAQQVSKLNGALMLDTIREQWTMIVSSAEQ